MKRIKVTEDLINKDKFEAALKVGMNDEGILNLFCINLAALYKWVKMVYKTHHPVVQIKKIRAEGELAFRANQFKLAQKNPALSIWIDKTWYGRKDESEDDIPMNDTEDLNPLLELLREDPADQKKEEPNVDSND